MTTFTELGIKQSILDGLKEIGFHEAFPIQVATIPVLLSGRDVVGQAHTGTGKTAAFSISMLQTITPKGGIQGLVVAPTRELAIQITDEIKKLARHTGIKPATVYGGQGMGIQLDALDRGVEIIVATPGRLIDHLKRGSIELTNVLLFGVAPPENNPLVLLLIPPLLFKTKRKPRSEIYSNIKINKNQHD